jgi:hypothetical protein
MTKLLTTTPTINHHWSISLDIKTIATPKAQHTAHSHLQTAVIQSHSQMLRISKPFAFLDSSRLYNVIVNLPNQYNANLHRGEKPIPFLSITCSDAKQPDDVNVL